MSIRYRDYKGRFAIRENAISREKYNPKIDFKTISIYKYKRVKKRIPEKPEFCKTLIKYTCGLESPPHNVTHFMWIVHVCGERLTKTEKIVSHNRHYPHHQLKEYKRIKTEALLI